MCVGLYEWCACSKGYCRLVCGYVCWRLVGCVEFWNLVGFVAMLKV